MIRKPTSDVTQAGVLELTLGTVLFMLALATAVSVGSGAGRNLIVSASPIFITLLFLGLLLLKRYIIDPRGMSLADVRPTRPVLLVFGALALYLMFSREVFGLADLLGMPVFLAAFLSGLFVVVGQGRRRFYVYVVTALAAAVLVSVFGVDDTSGAIWVALTTGCALLLTGGWVLAGFVKQFRA